MGPEGTTTATCDWDIPIYPEHSGNRLNITVLFGDAMEARHADRCYESALRLLTECDLRTLIRRVNADAIAEWIAKRLGRQGIASTLAVTVRLTRLGDSSTGSWLREQPNAQQRAKSTKYRRSSNRVKITLMPYQVGPGGRPAAPTTAHDWAISEEIIARGPAHLVSVVCPPYEKHTRDGRLAGYCGLHADAFADPKSYNSAYDYHGQLEGLSSTATLLAGAGLPRPHGTAVLADWALVDLPGVRTTLGDDASVIGRLDCFAESLRQMCARVHPDTSVLTLRELGASSHLPLGFSMDPAERYSWLRDTAADRSLPWMDESLLGKIIEIDDDQLVTFLDWRNYDKITGPRGPLITFLQTYRSIAWVRAKEALGTAVEAKALLADTMKETRRFAYYDALIRFVCYQLYASLITIHFGPTVCIYQDQTLTVAGNCFRQKIFPVLFLDPDELRKASSDALSCATDLGVGT